MSATKANNPNYNNDLKFNNSVPNMKSLSHKKQRCFKPEKLTEPKNFQLPNLIIDRLKNYNNVDTASDEVNLRPLIVEIGAGKGMHACLYAKNNPDHDLIAIERTLNKFNAFDSLVQSVSHGIMSLDNLVAVHADAIPYSVYALPASSIDAIFILYPNPEPKNPNQQWLNMPFFEFLLSRLKPLGKIFLASNINNYIDNAYKQSIDTWCLKTKRSHVPQESRRTHFEIKYLARGESCWELEMVKPEIYNTRFDSWNSPIIQLCK